MQTVLIVIHLMIVLALVGVVLIQRSEGGGLGIGGGSGFMSARGTANALTRTTAILAVLFFITSLGLGLLARYEARPTDILDRLPTTTTTDGLLDSLGPTDAVPKKETAPADPNAIPLGDDQSNATTPAVDTQPAATTATEEKPATATTTTTTEEKPAATATDSKPADTATTPATEEKPAQQQ
jgi:preprotein translocase subunit SecG